MWDMIPHPCTSSNGSLADCQWSKFEFQVKIHHWTGYHSLQWHGESGSHFNIKIIFPSIRIPIIKIRRSWDRLIFTMGILMMVNQAHETVIVNVSALQRDSNTGNTASLHWNSPLNIPMWFYRIQQQYQMNNNSNNSNNIVLILSLFTTTYILLDDTGIGTTKFLRNDNRKHLNFPFFSTPARSRIESHVLYYKSNDIVQQMVTLWSCKTA